MMLKYFKYLSSLFKWIHTIENYSYRGIPSVRNSLRNKFREFYRKNIIQLLLMRITHVEKIFSKLILFLAIFRVKRTK